MFEKPFLVVTDVAEGITSHEVYSTLKEAKDVVKSETSKGQFPICIYDLNTKRYVWNDEEYPPYGETICASVINIYLNSSN